MFSTLFFFCSICFYFPMLVANSMQFVCWAYYYSMHCWKKVCYMKLIGLIRIFSLVNLVHPYWCLKKSSSRAIGSHRLDLWPGQISISHLSRLYKPISQSLKYDNSRILANFNQFRLK